MTHAQAAAADWPRLAAGAGNAAERPAALPEPLGHIPATPRAPANFRDARDIGLDFTHALNFANTCRHLYAERPALWPKAAL
jgi:hypothetical protein